MKELTDAQKDALIETCNIGVSQAARQLSILLGDEVVINVPEVLLIAKNGASEVLNLTDNTNISAVSQYLHGDFEGNVSLLFHTEEGKSLVKSLIGSLHVISGVDMRDLEHEALVEIGNIIISSCMSAMANFLGDEITFGIPTFRETQLKNLLASGEEKTDSDENSAALIITTKLNAAKSEISGSLVISFTLASANYLMDKVDAIVNQYGGQSIE